MKNCILKMFLHATVYPGFFRVSQNLRKWGKYVAFFFLRQSFFGDFKSFLWKIV